MTDVERLGRNGRVVVAGRREIALPQPLCSAALEQSQAVARTSRPAPGLHGTN